MSNAKHAAEIKVPSKASELAARNLADLNCDLENISKIALSGAGSVSVAYTGALSALHEAGLLKSIDCYAGNSAGGIVAFFAALGYKGKELENAFLELNPRKLSRVNLNWFTNLRKHLRLEGFFSGRELYEEAQIICAQRIGKPNLTFDALRQCKQNAEQNNRSFFEDLYDHAMSRKHLFLKQKRNFKYDFEKSNRAASIDAMMQIARSFTGLQLTGTEVKRKADGSREYRNVVFNADKTPRLQVAKAIRITASLPFFFSNVQMKDKSGKVSNFTDGAISGLIPMENIRQDSTFPDGTLWIYAPRPVGENSLTDKANNFIAMRAFKLISRAIGLKEKKLSPEKKQPALELGEAVITKTINDFDRHAEECLNNTALTSKLLKVGRFGIQSENLNIGKRAQEMLIRNAYESTWREIYRLTDKNKPMISSRTGSGDLVR